MGWKKKREIWRYPQPFRIPVLIASHLESTFLWSSSRQPLSSTFPTGPHITLTPNSEGGGGKGTNFFSPSSTAVFLRRLFQIAARPLEKDYSSSTRCLKFRQLCSSSLPAPRSNRLENVLTPQNFSPLTAMFHIV